MQWTQFPRVIHALDSKKKPSAIECIFTYLIVGHMYSRSEEMIDRLHPL
jgi:hypothetical protein